MITTQQRDFLIEIGTEELPARLQKNLMTAFKHQMQKHLLDAGLGFSQLHGFVTPRRLAVLVEKLDYQQSKRQTERRGPALRAAYDAEGNPTPALLGFARSCQTDLANLEKLETEQGSWIIYRFTEAGKTIMDLMPIFVTQSLNALPITKPMRWGNSSVTFVRPVQWAVMMYGHEVIPTSFMELSTDRVTYGHRFMHPQPIELQDAAEYAYILKKTGRVIADFQQRHELIHDAIIKTAADIKGQAIIDKNLLDEVTGLVEWPQALLVPFDKKFLNLPHEVLSTAMQHHQKCFPLLDQQQQMLPYFITISNIKSKDPQEVIRGNERVMRARLADAEFFYTADCKQKLSDKTIELKQIIFQAKLGTLYDKSGRIKQLAARIATEIDPAIANFAERAGLLCKTDLLSAMVGEFPELQGTMGYYYALHSGEAQEVALAIRDHYHPRFANDTLPSTLAGCAVAIADRLDTLIGIFGINMAPTSDKDPFGLRRAALGTLRMLIENKLSHDLHELLQLAKTNYQQQLVLPNSNVVSEVHQFMLERLRAWYLEQDIAPDTIAAVFAANSANTKPFDIDKRMLALQAFRELPEAAALIAANKRVSNLLNKAGSDKALTVLQAFQQINQNLLKSEAETVLYNAIAPKIQQFSSVDVTDNYHEHLLELASLQVPVDAFFNEVLVMDEDETLRNNRLALLSVLRKLFLTVADISLLQT